MSPEIDPRIPDVRIQHRRHNEVLAELKSLIAVAKSYGGAIIPLLGPTQCGKTEVLRDAKTERLPAGAGRIRDMLFQVPKYDVLGDGAVGG